MEKNGATLIFPHQLFKQHPAVHPSRPVYLVEETLFFNQYNFNKKKLVLHRASMKWYAHHLSENNIEVNYIEATSALADVRVLLDELSNKHINKIFYADVVDNWLNSRIRRQCE